jgi:hypothetical protein
MDKSKVHHYWVAFKKPTLYFFVICAVLFSTLAVYSLRANNLKMLELKQAVLVADEKNGDIEGALQQLRAFVTTHMNTAMRTQDASEPPIQLINQFNRYMQAEQARVANQDTNKIYREAQARCESGAIPLTARAQCIQEFVLANGGGVQQLTIPPKELYTFDFASPRWAFDLAGISIILATTFYLLLIFRFIFARIMKHKL